jgi:hypothetical protein
MILIDDDNHPHWSERICPTCGVAFKPGSKSKKIIL